MHLTEKEVLVRQQEQLFGIQKLVKTAQLDLDDITALIPGLVHLNRLHTLELAYIDKQSREIIEVEKKDLRQNGMQLLKKHVKPESFQQAKKLFGHLDFTDHSKVVSHFQALKGFGGKDYEWYFSAKKRFNEEFILTISTPLSSLSSMQKQVEKVLEENLFIRKNLAKISSLTQREKEIMRLIAKGHDSKQIAEKLFISVHTVRTHRKNIWHKLDISSYAELFQYSQQFELM